MDGANILSPQVEADLTQKLASLEAGSLSVTQEPADIAPIIVSVLLAWFIAALLHPATRKAAGWVSLAVLLGVYPANFKMAGDSLKTRNTGFKAAALGRLPLQLPMLRAALRTARGR